MVEDGAFSHKIDFLGDSKSRRTSKSLHWFKSYGNFGERGILPSGGVALGRVCACSLRSRLDLKQIFSSISLITLKGMQVSLHRGMYKSSSNSECLKFL